MLICPEMDYVAGSCSASLSRVLGDSEETSGHTGTPTWQDQMSGGINVVLAQGGGWACWWWGLLVTSSLLVV